MKLLTVSLLASVGFLCVDAFRMSARPRFALQMSQIQGVAESVAVSAVEQPKRVPIGSVPVVALEGDSTEEQPYQQLAVGFHMSLVIANLLLAGAGIFSGVTAFSFTAILPLVATIIASIVIGDFGTGVFHWSVDNYGSINTPVVGGVCAAFQGHHLTPWTITFRKFCNNTFKISYGTAPWLLMLTAAPTWLVGTCLYYVDYVDRVMPWLCLYVMLSVVVIISKVLIERCIEEPMPVFFYRILQYTISIDA